MTTENSNQSSNEELTNAIHSLDEQSLIPKERRRRLRVGNIVKDQNNSAPIQFDYLKENMSIRTKLILLKELGILKHLQENFPVLDYSESLSKLLAEMITGDIDPIRFKTVYNSLRSDLSWLITPKESIPKEEDPCTLTAIKKANCVLTRYGLPLCKVS